MRVSAIPNLNQVLVPLMKLHSLCNLRDPELYDVQVVVEIDMFLLFAENSQVVAVATKVPFSF